MRFVQGLWVSALVALCLAIPAHTSAQSVSATTGAINGKVTDTTGAILPGATVTISSPSMQGVRTATTLDDGSYRFPAVPPGDYKITYELSGFTTVVREGIRVGLGFTATVNAELKLASLSETVTVTGESPVVDVASTRTATNFDAKELASLPSARDMWSILAAAPAVQMQRIDIGGSAAGTQTGYSTYDTKSDQHRPMVEGIVNTEGTNAAGYYYDYGSMDEVSVSTATNSAEMPWPGVMSQFIAKSGGNAYHGKLYADYENESIQSRNIDSAQIALGVTAGGGLGPTDLNRLHKYYDLNGDIGGFVKKDKFWEYMSIRDQDVQSLLPNFPVKPFETHLWNYSGKVTYALTTNNKFIGYAQWGKKQQPNRLDTFAIGATAAIHKSVDSTWNQAYWAHTYKAEWDSVLNDRAFFEIRGGQFHYKWPNFRYSNAPAFADLGTSVVSGGNRDGWFNIPTRNQVLGSFSYFKDNWAGSHNFKIGGEIFNERFDYLRGQDGLGYVPGDVLHILRNGNPTQVYLFESPSASLNGLWTYGLYASDTWRATSRLTITPGIVFDRYRSYLPAQQGPPVGRFNPVQVSFPAVDNLLTWNLPAPRIGFTYDLSGDGKTVIKGNYALYWWNPGTGYVDELVNPNARDWYKLYNWNDANRDGIWEPGEQTLLVGQSGGLGSTLLGPGLKDTRTREIAFMLEREVRANFGVHAGFVWRRIDQLSQQDNVNRPISAFNVPVMIKDPGPDGKIGTADDGPSIPGFNLDAAHLGLPPVNILHNTPGRDDFYNLELSATKRGGKWTLAGSYAYRWNRDNASSYFGQNLRVRDGLANPNDAINTDNGRYDFGTWTAKAHGTYDAPYGLKITPAIRLQSGQPYGRTFLAAAANGINYGTQRILAEPIGTRQQDNIILVDLRLEKVLKVGASQTIGVFVDGYNLTNANPASNIVWSSGSTFQQPITIIAPRLARFGVKFDW